MVLAKDKGLQGTIAYEPDLLPDRRKIDFVADRGRPDLLASLTARHK